MPNPTYQYSNGFDLIRVIPALTGRLKWMRDSEASPPASGRYFDDGSFHALVSEDLLRSVQPDKEITNEGFKKLKQRFEKAAIIRALNQVFRSPKAIDRPALLFEDVTQNPRTGLPPHDHVGMVLNIGERADIIARLESVILHFTADTPVRLMLMQAGSPEVLFETTVQAKAGVYTKIKLPVCMLSYGLQKATHFFFGYKASELQNGALPYIDDMVHNDVIAVGASFAHFPLMPFYAGTVYSAYQSYGLNLEVSSLYDYSDRITDSPELLDELIGLTAAAMFLEQAAYTRRTNTDGAPVDMYTRGAIMLDLNGALPVPQGVKTDNTLQERIAQECARVQKSFENKKAGVISYDHH